MADPVIGSIDSGVDPHAQRTRTAHRVFEEIERDGVADLEIVERRALA